MDSYKKNCISGRFLFAALLSTYNFPVGFGACMTNMGAAFMAADEPINHANYQFQIAMYNWAYGHLGDFFEDFAADTNCPLFKDLEVSEFNTLKINTTFGVKFSDGTVALSSQGSVAVNIMSAMFDQMRGQFEHLLREEGNHYFFTKKSGFMEGLWQPKTDLKNLMRTLWTSAVDENQRLFGVHIRRGDKLLKEAKEVPIRKFVDKLHEICRTAAAPCPKTVFLMHDEAGVFEKIGSMLNGSLQLYDFRTLLNHSGIVWNNSIYNANESPGDNRQPPNTKQLIIELTLLAMSDQIICTYSSNVCRTAALLRGSRENIHSLDVQEWYPW